ncbi:hypothetical protein BJX61DRAFT_301949 [Aspergillus egyptiacus]|nr:hypothetical protein BJX61DRAFT_301949 [Aspergillus egyptiacus]
MLAIPLILLAAGSLPSLITGAPIPSSPWSTIHTKTEETASHSLTKRAYNVLGGQGKIAEGWPSLDQWWPDFDDMFEANRDTMRQSCSQWNVPNNSDEEIDHISSAIQSVSDTTGVDPRFILAIVIQESNGCVRAPTTDNGVTNPGLMQSHNGVGSCNNNGQVLTPCPADQITQMIQDGTAGTAHGDGLQACLEQAGGAGDVSSYYRAARIYNSGSIAASGNLGQGIATHCYASDVANRLTGWATGPSSCQPGIIGNLQNVVETPPAIATPEPEPEPEPTSTSTSTSPASSTASASSSATPAPIYPYANPSCKEYYTVQTDDYCLKVESATGVSFAQLRELNTGLDKDCTNLWLGYQYCVKA